MRGQQPQGVLVRRTPAPPLVCLATILPRSSSASQFETGRHLRGITSIDSDGNELTISSLRRGPRRSLKCAGTKRTTVSTCAVHPEKRLPTRTPIRQATTNDRDPLSAPELCRSPGVCLLAVRFASAIRQLSRNRPSFAPSRRSPQSELGRRQLLPAAVCACAWRASLLRSRAPPQGNGARAAGYRALADYPRVFAVCNSRLPGARRRARLGKLPVANSHAGPRASTIWQSSPPTGSSSFHLPAAPGSPSRDPVTTWSGFVRRESCQWQTGPPAAGAAPELVLPESGRAPHPPGPCYDLVWVREGGAGSSERPALVPCQTETRTAPLPTGQLAQAGAARAVAAPSPPCSVPAWVRSQREGRKPTEAPADQPEQPRRSAASSGWRPRSPWALRARARFDREIRGLYGLAFIFIDTPGRHNTSSGPGPGGQAGMTERKFGKTLLNLFIRVFVSSAACERCPQWPQGGSRELSAGAVTAALHGAVRGGANLSHPSTPRQRREARAAKPQGSRRWTDLARLPAHALSWARGRQTGREAEAGAVKRVIAC
eukprot:scaffold106_cov380-Prasinococcus_capsulatus_cf.AAC.29